MDEKDKQGMTLVMVILSWKHTIVNNLTQNSSVSTIHI